jgi:hypothetical protein
MRRLTVLRLPFQLVFPGENVIDSDSFGTEEEGLVQLNSKY